MNGKRPRQTSADGRPIWQDELVLTWVARRMKAGRSRDEMRAEAAAGKFGWPLPGVTLPQNAADRCRAIVQDREGRPSNGRAKNWSGKTNPARMRELKARSKSDAEAFLYMHKLQLALVQQASYLEAFRAEDLYDYGTNDEVWMWRISDLYEDLISLDLWNERVTRAIGTWLKDSEKSGRIAKLRNVAGCTPEEAALRLEKADQLERQLALMGGD